MAKPINRATFSTYILEELGQPVIRINVSANQVEHAIDESLDFYQEYHEASQERTYLAIQLTAGDVATNTVTLPSNVVSVLTVIDPNVFGGSVVGDPLFSINYHLGSDMVWQMQGQGTGSMVSYAITRQYMAEMDAMMSPAPPFRFRHHNGVLHVDQKLESILGVGKFIVVECMQILDPDLNPRIWGDRYLRRLATAYLKLQWGMNLSKYENIQLPSGITMNGTQLVATAKEEIQVAENDIRMHMEPFGVIVA
jgi:hypothetical protein